jgi:ethanolamine utilization microcompartment shell protein EutL
MATFGTIDNPFSKVSTSGALQGSANGSGLIIIGNNILKLMIVMAGVYAFVNIIIAGYAFLSANDSKEVAKAWSKIWQSMMGLAFVAGSFILAAIFGYVIFGDATALLQPKFYAP